MGVLDMVDKLQPFWADFSTSCGLEFADFLAKHGDEVAAAALLSVTDARAAASGRPAIIKAYSAVRSSAAKHVQASLLRVAIPVLKYAV